jgi:hypothetical protein
VAGARLTERDKQLLAFMAEHRLVLASHVQAFLGVSAQVAHGRLRALAALGMVAGQRLFHGEPGCHQITRRGLAAIGADLPAPRLDLRGYRHDVGVAWLWLAAEQGGFGALREVVSERRMRSRDGTADGRAEPLGVRLGGTGPTGEPRLHYPDLLLVDSGGHRIAVELELSGKGRERRERIIAGYGADPRFDAVLYLVDRDPVGRSVASSAARLGLGPLVHVQRVQWDTAQIGGRGRAGERTVIPESGRAGIER